MFSRTLAAHIVELLEAHHDNPPMQWDVHFLSDTRADFRLITTGADGLVHSLAIISTAYNDGRWRPLEIRFKPVPQCASPWLVQTFCILSAQASLEAGVQ